MKPIQAKSGSVRRTKAEVVVTDASGHKAAVAPFPEAPAGRLHPTRILVPVDFSPSAAKAVQYADAFAATFGAIITLLHVVEPMVLPAEFGYAPAPSPEEEVKHLKAIRARLQNVAADLDSAVQSQVEVRIGRPWQEITQAVTDLGIDLLVITTHGRTGIKHVLMGSVAEKIVRHAACPVLVVRPEEKDFVG
jgi:nucleotide-binding universal stress UspA family protein